MENMDREEMDEGHLRMRTETINGYGYIPQKSSAVSTGSKMPGGRWGNIFNRWISRAIEEAEIDSDDPELIARAASKAATEVIKDIETGLSFVKEKYRDKLLKRGRRFPLPWMMKDPNLMTSFRRNKLIEVLNFLDANSLEWWKPKNQALVKERYFPPGGKTKLGHPYSLIKVDSKFYDKAKDELGMSRISFQGYLRALSKLQFVKPMKKVRQGPMIYADGYQTEYKNEKTKSQGTRKVFFITAKCREKLLSFRVS
jgi:hypothetical protein